MGLESVSGLVKIRMVGPAVVTDIIKLSFCNRAKN